MGSLLRYFFTFLILGSLVYGLLFVAMGFPHPRWMRDLLKETIGYELKNTTTGPDYHYDPSTGNVYKKE